MLRVRVFVAVGAFVVAGCAAAIAGTSVAAKIAVGGQPCGVVGAGGSAWVSDAAGARITRIDPATNTVTGRFPVDPTPCEVTAALGSLWLVTQSGKLDRIDPASGTVVARIPIGRISYDVTYTAGAIWVTNREGRSITRIDPKRNRVTKTLRFPGLKPAGIVGAAGGVWVGDDYGSAVYRLDPRTLRWSRVHTGADASSWMAAAGRIVFVSNTSSNSVTRIDARTRKVLGTTKVCESPVNLEAIGGDAWVPCDGNGRVDRVGADGIVRESIGVGANPAVVTGIGGEVWVSVFDAGTVWRLTPG